MFSSLLLSLLILWCATAHWVLAVGFGAYAVVPPALLVTCVIACLSLGLDQLKALQKDYGRLQQDVLQFQKNQTNLERKFSYDL